jgi:hypothetical protein
MLLPVNVSIEARRSPDCKPGLRQERWRRGGAEILISHRTRLVGPSMPDES